MILTAVRHLPPDEFVSGSDDYTRDVSEEGHAQGPLLASTVSRHRYRRAYVSPYKRCVSTARYLRDHADEFFEAVELRESAHPGMETWVRKKALALPESMFDLRDRVARFLDFALGGSSENILLVTHADVINAVRWHVCGLTTDEFLGLYDNPDNFIGMGSVWAFDLDDGTLTRSSSDGSDLKLAASFPPRESCARAIDLGWGSE